MPGRNVRGRHARGDVSDEQLTLLQEAAEKHKDAQRQFTKALGVLWNAQADLAVASQNSALLQRVTAGPLKIFDDCDCCSIIII